MKLRTLPYTCICCRTKMWRLGAKMAEVKMHTEQPNKTHSWDGQGMNSRKYKSTQEYDNAEEDKGWIGEGHTWCFNQYLGCMNKRD